jgi:copper chaperone CopZ
MTTIFRFAASILLGAGVSLGGCASSASSAPGGPDAPALGTFKGHDGPVIAFKVQGMACRNCANEIARELMEVPGVHGATIDFDTATAQVALDPDPAKAATMQALHTAVEHWRSEHFSVKEDPNCLDPQRREEIQRGQTE